MTPLRILLLSDGRPGHFNLSEGIVAAMQRRRPCVVTRMAVRLPRWAGRPLALACRMRVPPAAILRALYRLDPGALAPADIVVSAGAATLGANVAAARHLGAANVFYGSLRRFDPGDFTLALSSYESATAAANQIAILKPGPLDPDRFAVPAPMAGRPPRVAGLVVGGPSGTFSYASGDWDRLLAFLAETHAAHGTRWIAANAPRTPEDVSRRLAEAAGAAGSGIVRFIDFRATGPGSLAPLLGESDAILASDDSSSMVSEAIAARRAVIGAVPGAAFHPPPEQRYRDFLAANRWYRPLAIADLSPGRWLEALSALAPRTDNALDALADVLALHLPALAAADPAAAPPRPTVP